MMRLLPGFVLAAALTLPALAGPPHDMPVRHVDGNSVISPENPAATIRIDPAFHPLPDLSFGIEKQTWVDRRVFVDTQDARVRRMVVVHFEQALDGSDFRFQYPAKPPRDFAGYTWRFGAYDYDGDQEARLNPGREETQMRSFLRAQGLIVPHIWRTVRLARVSDGDGKSEIVIFYMEAQANVSLMATPADESEAEISSEDADDAFKRFTATVSMSHGS